MIPENGGRRRTEGRAKKKFGLELARPGNFEHVRSVKSLFEEEESHTVKLGANVNSVRGSYQKSMGRETWERALGWRWYLWLTLGFLLVIELPAIAQTQSPSEPSANKQGATAAEQVPAPALPGTISGTVVDRTGAVVPGAMVKLLREGALGHDVASDNDGAFSFARIAPGPFQLLVTSAGFAAQYWSGLLRSGENLVLPPITLAVATAASEVQVSLTPVEMAEAEIKDEEKQRVLGVIPNFYVTYNPAAVPLHPKQKFELAWKATIDPVTFGITGVIAGIQQANNSFSGYGQGAEGYAKR